MIMGAHICNLNYPGSRDGRIKIGDHPGAKEFTRPHLKKKKQAGCVWWFTPAIPAMQKTEL
jgi:hypothetical protein